MYVSYALSGVALLGTIAWAVVDERSADWRAHQAEHALVAGRAVDIALRQHYLPALGVADRCGSCHLGIDDPDLAGAPQPHGAHPGTLLDSHPPERFGCTPCHGGDGRFATYEGAAHVPGPRSLDPMSPPGELEARCGVCHGEPVVAGAPVLTEGRRVLAESGCAACHEIPGVRLDGPFGPSLDAVGAKLPREAISGWLRDPGAVRPDTRMPSFRLDDGQREALADFLAAQRLVDAPTPDLADADPDAGRSLFGKARCTTCHAVKGRGGTLGPPLDRIGERLSPAWLAAWLRDPHRVDPDTAMPLIRFEEQEVIDLVAFLVEEMVSDDGVAPVIGPVPGGARIEAGRRVFDELGCAACHVVRGVERERQFAPSLRGFGATPVERLAFAGLPEGTRRTRADWIYRKIERPELQQPIAKMPLVRLEPPQVAAATVAVLSLREPGWPHVRAHEPPAAPVLRGEVGVLFDRFRCLSCHQLGGVGGTVSGAPLDREGSKVEAAWVERFLLAPDTIRVGQQERMPHLGLRPEEAQVLAQWMTLVLRDDAIPTEAPAGGEAARGAEFVETLGCRGCHPIDGKGGYVGPDLVRTGARLRAGWVYGLLRTPALMRPEVLHPDWGLAEADAASVVAYLKGLAPTAAEVEP